MNVLEWRELVNPKRRRFDEPRALLRFLDLILKTKEVTRMSLHEKLTVDNRINSFLLAGLLWDEQKSPEEKLRALVPGNEVEKDRVMEELRRVRERVRPCLPP